MKDFAHKFSPPLSTGLIWQWLRWEDDPRNKYATRISAERAVEIERITSGKLNRRDLRPDLFADAA